MKKGLFSGAVIIGLISGLSAHAEHWVEVETYKPAITYKGKTCSTYVTATPGRKIPGEMVFVCNSPSGRQCSFDWDHTLGITLSITTYEHPATADGHDLSVQTNYDLKKVPNTSVFPTDPTLDNKGSMDYVASVAQKWISDACDAQIPSKPASVNVGESSKITILGSNNCSLETESENGVITDWNIDCVTPDKKLNCHVGAELSKKVNPYEATSYKSSNEKTNDSTTSTFDDGPSVPVRNFDEFKQRAIEYLKERCQDVLYPATPNAPGGNKKGNDVGASDAHG